MPATPLFLIVADVAENRFLLSQALLRQFPQAIIQECVQSAPALAAAAHAPLAAIVVHRADDADGVGLIARLRRTNLTVPIVMISERQSCPEAITAGASLYLRNQAWGRVGAVLKEVLAPRAVPSEVAMSALAT